MQRKGGVEDERWDENAGFLPNTKKKIALKDERSGQRWHSLLVETITEDAFQRRAQKDYMVIKFWHEHSEL